MNQFERIRNLAGDLAIWSREDFQHNKSLLDKHKSHIKNIQASRISKRPIQSQGRIENLQNEIRAFENKVNQFHSWFYNYRKNYQELIGLMSCENKDYRISPSFQIKRIGNKIEAVDDNNTIYEPLTLDQ